MRKSQSAMEYLMTYGWAILAIAIVMVSLYSLGIFNSGSLQPTATTGSCKVLRTVAQTSLAGQCNGLIPKYVAKFNGGTYLNSVRSFSNPSNAYTISVWVDVLDTSTEQFFVSDPGYDPALGIAAGGSVCTDGLGNCFGTGTLSQGTWYSYIVTYNPSNLTTYINCVPSSVTHGGVDPMSSAQVGQFAGLYTKGLLANVQMYNTSLDLGSAKALCREGIGGAPIDVQHLVGWWPLNGDLLDYSGNNNNLAISAGKLSYSGSWQSGYTTPAT